MEQIPDGLRKANDILLPWESGPSSYDINTGFARTASVVYLPRASIISRGRKSEPVSVLFSPRQSANKPKFSSRASGLLKMGVPGGAGGQGGFEAAGILPDP